MILFCVAMAILPLCFLAVYGMETPFGVLSTSDFVMPFVYLALLPGVFRRRNRPVFPQQVIVAFVLFAAWALLSTVSIPMRFPSTANPEFHTINGLLKLGKFVEYALFGYLLIPWLDDPRRIRIFHWSFMASTFMLAMNSAYMLFSGMNLSEASDLKGLVQGGANAISVLLATLMVYWCGVLMVVRMKPLETVAVVGALVAALGGIACTLGRGGWVSLICGTVYLFFALGGLRYINGKVLLLGAATVAMLAVLVATVPQLEARVASTLDPYASSSKVGYNTVIESFGMDDGGRFDILVANLLRLPNHILLGSGFFHRGDASGVSLAGTHNFFADMIMATGIVGAVLLAWMWYFFWFRLGRGWPYYRNDICPSIIFRATLFTITVGCLSGEYLYGGVTTSTLSALIALTVAQNRLAALQQTGSPLPVDLLSRRFLLAGRHPGLQT